MFINFYKCRSIRSLKPGNKLSVTLWEGGGWRWDSKPIFPMAKNGEKSIFKERETHNFPSLSIYFFAFFPMGKNGKRHVFPMRKIGFDTPPLWQKSAFEEKATRMTHSASPAFIKKLLIGHSQKLVNKTANINQLLSLLTKSEARVVSYQIQYNYNKFYIISILCSHSKAWQFMHVVFSVKLDIKTNTYLNEGETINVIGIH